MAFSPPRLLLGIMTAFLLVVTQSIHASIFSSLSPTEISNPVSSYAIDSLINAALSFNPGAMLIASLTLLESWATQLTAAPWSTAALLVPMILITGIFGYAITRSASIQFAFGRQLDTVDSLTSALQASRQIALATLGPLLIAAILCSLVMLIGLPLGLPIVNIIGSLLYALGLLLSLLIVSLLTIHTLTLPLTISALTIEGTDGFDAIFRTYAYILARPIRLTIYALILIVVGTLTFTIVAAVSTWSIEMANTLTSTLTNDAGRRILTGSPDMSATEPLAHNIVQIARSILQLIVAGYAMSLIFCSTTMAYLCIRRVCDGQDIQEIWNPNT